MDAERALKRGTLWLPMALMPALLVIGALFVGSLVYAFAESLGRLRLIGTSELSLRAYGEVLFGERYAARLWEGLLFSAWISAAQRPCILTELLRRMCMISVSLQAAQGFPPSVVPSVVIELHLLAKPAVARSVRTIFVTAFTLRTAAQFHAVLTPLVRKGKV